MIDLGVRLQLLLGPTVPVPAPFEVVDALTEIEVHHNDDQRDGFQLNFTLGRSNTARDFGLLQSGRLDPPNRVTIVVIIQGLPQVLINGIITRHQVIPSNEPGQSQLRVTGEDTGLEMDLEEKSATYRDMSDSAIVEQILGNYRRLNPVITATTEAPPQVERIVTQQVSDLAFIQRLARRNSFVFYTEPTPVPGRSTAYWGPKERPGQLPQAALTMNMGAETNVEQISFDFNALGPVTPQATIVEPLTGLALPIPVPNLLSPALSSQPASPLRRTVLRDTANLNAIQAALRALQAATESADAVVGSGQLDAIRYGRALRSRQRVGVRGAGQSHDGTYYVKQVTHRIKRGEYKQSFTLTREGRGASSQTV
ncbi:MAG: contractile injection system protein, VgrG/Pvc8 family [Chloroflexota bacterium]